MQSHKNRSLDETEIYSMQVFKLGTDLHYGDHVVSVFHETNALRACITSDPTFYISEHLANSHKRIANDWLSDIIKACQLPQKRTPLFLIIEQSKHNQSGILTAIKSAINHEYRFPMNSSDPIFSRSGNPIAHEKGIHEIQLGSTIHAYSRFSIDCRANLTHPQFNDSVNSIKLVYKVLCDLREVTCMDESLSTILNKSFESPSDPWVFLQMWEIMNDSEHNNRTGIVSHLHKDSAKTLKDRKVYTEWLVKRSRTLDATPKNLTEQQRNFRNAIAHQDMEVIRKIIQSINESKSEALLDVRVGDLAHLTRIMNQKMRSDIFEWLVTYAKSRVE